MDSVVREFPYSCNVSKMVKSTFANRVDVWQHVCSFLKHDTNISGSVSWDNNFRPYVDR